MSELSQAALWFVERLARLGFDTAIAERLDTGAREELDTLRASLAA